MPLPSFSILILIRLATTDNNEEVYIIRLEEDTPLDYINNTDEYNFNFILSLLLSIIISSSSYSLSTSSSFVLAAHLLMPSCQPWLGWHPLVKRLKKSTHLFLSIYLPEYG